MVRYGASLAAVIAIAGCTALAPSRTVSFLDGTVVAVAPSGYCIDAQASKPKDGFAVIASCATLDATQTPPAVVGVVTMQVGPAGSGTIAQDEIAMRDFLITPAGAALLSHRGNAQDVTILSAQAFDRQIMVHFTDKGPPPVAGLQNEEWRAFTEIDGRLVTIGVRGLAAAPLQDGPGASLLKLILAGVQPAPQG